MEVEYWAYEFQEGRVKDEVEDEDFDFEAERAKAESGQWEDVRVMKR